MLPIYLEHLLFPTLSDSAFMTEIHHVNADGLDAGESTWSQKTGVVLFVVNEMSGTHSSIAITMV